MASPSPRAWTISRLSLSFTLDQVSAGLAGLSPLDALLVLAVNQANIAPLTRDPTARQAYGALQNAAPDDARRPASINAIANSLGIPFETTRRRLKRLEIAGVCTIVPGAGVVIPEAFLTSPAYFQSVMAAHDRLVGFYGRMLAGDLLDPLPPTSYDVDDGVPLRGAARLIADYLLRGIDGLMRESGDAVTAVTLLATLVAALDEVPWPPEAEWALAAVPFRSTTVAHVSRRLGLPNETVRRHATRLMEAGLCRKTPEGVSVAQDLLTRRPFQALADDHAHAVQRLFAGLAERGVVAAWEQMGAGAAPRRRA
ncbi:Lrp/AsnC family transcriptional regulator [Phenylobacterium sp.]|uniref:Lrp/AsnC family transcriptional regulator n=1 Tax=Phenylobacterium sp. TaxID=1871053 RepID=UPI002EDA2119